MESATLEKPTLEKPVIRDEPIPYKFLDYFNENDRSSFAGRDQEIRDIVARICQERGFVLYGRSGLGKTSVLLAGVFPGLRERGFKPVYIRLLQSPVVDFRDAVFTAFGSSVPVQATENANTTPVDDSVTLKDEIIASLQTHSDKSPVVLVFDQFEEFFIRFRETKAERENFIRCISELSADDSLDLRIVFSLREDYLANLDDMRVALPGLSSNEYRLLPLTAYGTRQAIVQPLINSHIQFDNRLVSRLVDELATVNFDPPLMQIICTEVYRVSKTRTQKDMHLTEDDLQKVGGITGIFRRYLDSAIEHIPPKHHLLLRNVLDLLITRENTKRAVTREDMLSSDFVAKDEELNTVLELLHSHRIIRRQKLGDDIWYELIHERLVEVILDWLQLDREYFEYRVARDLIRNNAKGELFLERPQVLLPIGAITDVVGPFKDRLRLNREEQDFILLSCIFRQSPQVEYWIERLGITRIKDWLRQLLGHENAEMRAGAAWTVQVLGQEGQEFAEQCMQLAVNDDEEAVRRDAGRAFGTVALTNQIHLLKAFLKEKKTHRRTVEVLADINEVNRKVGGFTWWQRFRANHLYRRRIFRQHTDEIAQKRMDGTLWALGGGVIWTLSTGVILSLWVTWLFENDPYEWFKYASWLHGIGSAVAVILATLIGWRSAVTAVKTTLINKEAGWYRCTRKMWTTSALVLIAVFVLSLVLFDVFHFDRYVERFVSSRKENILITLFLFSAFVLAIPLTMLFTRIVSAFSVFNRYILAGCASNVMATFWLLVMSAAIPISFSLILLNALIFLLEDSLYGKTEEMMLFTILLITSTSLVSFSASVGIWRSIGTGSVDTKKARQFRLAGIGIVILAYLILNYHYNLNNTPIWPERVAIKSIVDRNLPVRLPNGPGGGHMLRLKLGDKQFHVVTIDVPTELNVYPSDYSFNYGYTGYTTQRQISYLVNGEDGLPLYLKSGAYYQDRVRDYNLKIQESILPDKGFVELNNATLAGWVTIKYDKAADTECQGDREIELQSAPTSARKCIKQFTGVLQFKIPKHWQLNETNGIIIRATTQQPLLKYEKPKTDYGEPPRLYSYIYNAPRPDLSNLSVGTTEIYPVPKNNSRPVPIALPVQQDYARVLSDRLGDPRYMLGEDRRWQGKLTIKAAYEWDAMPKEWEENELKVLVLIGAEPQLPKEKMAK